jgi:ATP-dependent helicase HrpB
MAMIPTDQLPIFSVVDDVKRALAENPCVVLQAPPGAGKTTIIPLVLLNEMWMARSKMIVLAPRRLAARAAAMRMADLLGESVGRTVGYRMRMESRVGRNTRIEVVTEGVLTRMLQGDPSLEGVGLVVFDEFHERNLDGDTGLALCLDIQGVLNESLRLLVMSATLDCSPVADLLGRAPIMSCAGRSYPVETRFVGDHTPSGSVESVVNVVLRATREERGNILVFLPGAAEIHAAARKLDEAQLGSQWIVAPLYGNLTLRAQNQAIEPPGQGKRKIVLATSIAETSLTIEGIRVVIDSGLQRLPQFDLRSGLSRLVTRPVSQASADQRCGRAGRSEPGVCLRLWSRHAHAALPPAHRPEICEADLAGLALELALWGVGDPGRLKWLDPPPMTAYQNARILLQRLEAMDDRFTITPHGRCMASLPLHPRLAHMVLASEATGHGAAACDLAALLMERDVLRFEPGRWDPDLRLRFDLLQTARREGISSISRAEIDSAALRRTMESADVLRNRLGLPLSETVAPTIGQLLIRAYPDRVAQARPGRHGKFRMASGQGAYVNDISSLATEDYLVAAALDGRRREARIFLAAAFGEDLLMEQCQHRMGTDDEIAWDAQQHAVTARRVTRYDALTVRSEPLIAPDPQAVLSAMLDGIRSSGIECLPWTRMLVRWRERVAFLGRFDPGAVPWPDTTDEGLTANLEQWLGPWLAGITRLKQLVRIDFKAALFGLLTHDQHRLLDRLAPTHITVPSGSRLAIDYSGEVPVLAVRLQEMFGLTQTPAIVDGRQRLLIHLLSPAGRPVQITRDLAGFWQTGYQVVKRELKGRYPKHFWPDDPLRAAPTATVKKSRKRT